MSESPRLLDADALVAVHDRLIELYGGPGGLRSRSGLESAVVRVEHLAAYSDRQIDVCAAAAALAYGLCRLHHPFVDGNKRTAFAAVFIVLSMNDWRLRADPEDAAGTFESVAAGEIDESALEAWIRRHAVPNA